MTQRFVRAFLRLMKYALFMGFIGGLASFIGPPHSGLIKAGMGVVLGAMLLGKKLPDALKELWAANEELFDDNIKD